MTQEDFYDFQVAAMLSGEQDVASVIAGWDATSGIEIRYIDKHAIIAQLPWGAQGHDYQWSEVATRKFRQHHVIDFALWSGDELCGLCCAYAWPGSGEIAIEALQGNPDREHKLKGNVIRLSKYVLEGYGTLVGASQIVVDQAEPGSEVAYRKNGFHPYRSGFAYAIPKRSSFAFEMAEGIE